MEALCRDCFAPAPADRGTACGACGSARVVRHRELARLSIAHVDCDAFYAAVEKRDDPSLRDRAVLVGGGRRGVVMAACYTARRFGIRSAMPMFEALRACPDAAVIRPDMTKYAAVGREMRALLNDVTPAVEPISIDEAVLDLSGTERLHRASPAETLARLARRIEAGIGITVSIGLSYNRFLAKIASGMDKPRGFFVIGRGDARRFLAGQPVTLLWGVGEAMRKRLAADGIATIGDLQGMEEEIARAPLRRDGTAARAAFARSRFAPRGGRLRAQEPVRRDHVRRGPHPLRRSDEAPLAARREGLAAAQGGTDRRAHDHGQAQARRLPDPDQEHDRLPTRRSWPKRSTGRAPGWSRRRSTARRGG